MRQASVAVVVLLALTACSNPQSFVSAGPEWIDRATGTLIALKVHAGECDSDQIVLVESDWAALIVWNGRSRYFCLYDKGRGAYLATESWPEFLSALRSVPEGTSVQRFYKCSAPWDHDMPDSEVAQLETMMKSRRLSWRDFKEGEVDTLMICIHYTGRVDFPPR